MAMRVAKVEHETQHRRVVGLDGWANGTFSQETKIPAAHETKHQH